MMLLPVFTVKDIVLSDHFAIAFSIDTQKPLLPTKELAYNKTKSIDMDKFISGIANSRLLTLEIHDVDTLANIYNEVLSEILDAHALIKKIINIHPSAPWYSDDILSAKRECRTLEKQW